MNKTEEKLLNEFKKIADKGWKKSISKSSGSIGITFEKELGNKENSSFLPDYNDIEIKCSSKYGYYPITLFSCAFDGPSNLELKRITEKYGYFDNIYQDKKILYAFLSCKSSYLIDNKFYFKLEMDYDDEKLYLLIYDINKVLLEREAFVSFKTLFKHLNIKFQKLALIYGTRKTDNKENFFKYYQIDIYKLKDYKLFLNLIENGIIYISLISRINKSINNGGKYKNKNLIFSIRRENINLLFDKILYYEK